MPAASHVEKDGTFTQTQRMLQWRDKAVEPPGDARSDLWFYFHLGRILRERLKDSTDPRDRPLLDLTWDYPTHGETARPERRGGAARDQRRRPRRQGAVVLHADEGRRVDDRRLLDLLRRLRRRGQPGRPAQAARRSRARSRSEWGWAWPLNRRILYNRASADPDGKPWSERKKYVWWDEDAGRVDRSTTSRTSRRPSARTTCRRRARRAQDAIGGADPFVMQSDGKAWLFAPAGVVDGPLPTHYEPAESPVENALYEQQSNPTIEQIAGAVEPEQPARAATSSRSWSPPTG